MEDVNTAFCRTFLALVKNDLTRKELTALKNHGLTWSGPTWHREYTFEWPEMNGTDPGPFMWYGRADNASDARAQALSYWLEHHAPAIRARS